jgi:hypothetical protein
MSNETAKMRNDVRVWGVDRYRRERSREKRRRDVGRKNEEEQRGKKGVKISVRMRGRWFMESYVG